MSHLTYEQRYTIEILLQSNESKSSIANKLNLNKSVISREVKRNSDQRSGEYKAKLAQKKYCERLVTKPKRKKATTELIAKIEDLIKEDYSPEQVTGVLKKRQEPHLSHEWIYQHIWKDKKAKGDLHNHLRRQGRRYRKRGASKDNRGVIKDRVSIEKRPKIVEKRERFGDLEVDLIIGKNHKQAILTINDRASGVLKMRKIPSKEAKVVSHAIIEELQEWSPYIKTITADNGKEFAAHKDVAEQLGIDFYFARPYHSWERGSNENLNGLIRQYFKKSSPFETITKQRIKEIETKLNRRPRKRFNFENPTFVMEKLLFNHEVAFVT